jgi:hypothetical protein
MASVLVSTTNITFAQTITPYAETMAIACLAHGFCWFRRTGRESYDQEGYGRLYASETLVDKQ